MLNTAEAISELLQQSFLKDQEIYQFEIDGLNQVAFALKMPRNSAFDAWSLMRSWLGETGRYLLITEGWGSDDFFSRWFYKEEETAGRLQNTSPDAIAESSLVDLEAFLEAEEASDIAFSPEEIGETIQCALEATRERFGSCPETVEIQTLIDNNTIQSRVDLERWLFEWEIQTFGYENAITAQDTEYLEWYEPNVSKLTLLLLPTEHSWNSLAYMHFGTGRTPSTIAISFLKKWHQQYEAEIVFHYGTILQLNVGKLPSNRENAFRLAWEQEAMAECTTILPGISLRDHARSLLSVNRWFLHDRP